MEQTNNSTLNTPDLESPTRKVAAAILGAIVVIIAVLILILGIQGVRSLIARNQKLPAKTTPTPSLSVYENRRILTPASTISGQTVSYQTMPATGPREDAMAALVILAIMGSGIVVVSRKFS